MAIKKSTEDILLKAGIGKAELLDAKADNKKTGKPVVQILKEKKILSEKDYMEVRAKILDVPFVNLAVKTIEQNTLKHIPQDIAKKYQIVCFGTDKESKALKIATTKPEDYVTLEFIQKTIGQEIDPYLALKSDIAKALDQYSGIQTEVEKAIKTENLLPTSKKDLEKISKVDAIRHDSPLAKLVDTIFEHAVIGGASDIHIEPTAKTLDIRYRIDGILRKTITLPMDIHKAVISRIKILSNLKIDESRLPQDGRFHGVYGEREVDFRVSSLPMVNGEKIVMRILDKSTGILTLEQLGVKGKPYDILQTNIHKPHGMTLVTGPTGAGKSTTNYAIIGILNNVGMNIVTLEDPVEYYIDGINQSQVNHNIDYSFASGLRAIVRQDPDAIMIGEIRDLETADMAVHAALTGHIVLSTLHTNDAAGAVPRLIDMGIEPFLLASSINVIIAQRLARKICPHCRTALKVPREIITKIKMEITNLPKEYQDKIRTKEESITVYKGTGCSLCNQSGYKGRIGIFEILPLEDEAEILTNEKASAKKIHEAAIKAGMISLKQDGIMKVLDGVTTMEEFWRVISE